MPEKNEQSKPIRVYHIGFGFWRRGLIGSADIRSETDLDLTVKSEYDTFLEMKAADMKSSMIPKFREVGLSDEEITLIEVRVMSVGYLGDKK